MLRRYFPKWLKEERTEFLLELFSTAALIGVVIYYILT